MVNPVNGGETMKKERIIEMGINVRGKRRLHTG